MDELGGLDDAIAFAAGKAGIAGNYRLTEYPRQKELIEAIQELLEKAAPGIARSKSGLDAKLAERVASELKMLRAMNDPHGVYTRLPLTLNIR